MTRQTAKTRPDTAVGARGKNRGDRKDKLASMQMADIDVASNISCYVCMVLINKVDDHRIWKVDLDHLRCRTRRIRNKQ